jgi:F-type H+-transporting ATPase subunit delta
VRDETIARNYADALFELAAREDRREAYGEALETVARLLAENRDVKVFLETPRIDAEAKKRVMRDVFAEDFPRHVMNFLQVTVDKRRQRLLEEISEAYHELLDQHMGRSHVEVTVARPYDEKETAELADHLSHLLETKVVPHVRVKPGILGGVLLRTGDTIFDGTLRRRLDGMRRSLMTAHLPETESPLRGAGGE